MILEDSLCESQRISKNLQASRFLVEDSQGFSEILQPKFVEKFKIA